MSYITARDNAARFRALTGVAVYDFDSLLPYFTDAHDEYFRWHTVDGKKRSGRIPAMWDTDPETTPSCRSKVQER